MAQVACSEAMELLNFVFSSGIISNDGHEILERLQVGDDLVEFIGELGETKFNRAEQGRALRAVGRAWPSLDLELIQLVAGWALGKLDTDDRVLIRWKGDDEHPEVVTRLELRDHTLVVEFAHPPAGIQVAQPG